VQEEAARVMMLKHPFVMRFVEAYWENKSLVIVTEFCNRGDLSSWLTRNKTTASNHDRQRIFAQLADSIAYIHSCHVIHRDLKPPNILLNGPQYTVKLADFGVSRSVEEGGAAQTFCGTPLYMAPEVHRRVAYGPACDVFSLGCILHELATGRKPFNTVVELMDCKRKEATIPKWCKSLVDLMLKKNPEQRPLAEALLSNTPSMKKLYESAGAFEEVWARRRLRARPWPSDPRILRNVMSFILFVVPMD